MCAILLLVVANAISPLAMADSVEMQNGSSIACVVLQESPVTITILYGSSVLRVPRSSVVSVNRGDAQTEPPTTAEQPISRLPDYKTIVVTVAVSSWASDLRQIPATVIDTGILRNVPYKSHRAGRDYEINVYGDPISPSGFEIGVHGSLLVDDKAKQNCLECALKLLGEKEDREVIRGMSLEKDEKARNGLTFEITPPTAPDVYGGWWISVYSKEALDAVRASDKEIELISVARGSVSAQEKSHKPAAGSRRCDNMDELSNWSEQDLHRARAPSTSAARP